MVLEAEEAEAAILIALHPVSAEGEEAALFFGKFQSELSQSSGEHTHEGFGFIAVLERADEVIGITHEHGLSAEGGPDLALEPVTSLTCFFPTLRKPQLSRTVGDRFIFGRCALSPTQKDTAAERRQGAREERRQLKKRATKANE